MNINNENKSLFWTDEFKKSLQENFDPAIKIYQDLYEFADNNPEKYCPEWEFLGDGFVLELDTSKCQGEFFSCDTFSWKPVGAQNEFTLLLTGEGKIFHLEDEAELLFTVSSEVQLLDFLSLLIKRLTTGIETSQELRVTLNVPFYRYESDLTLGLMEAEDGSSAYKVQPFKLFIPFNSAADLIYSHKEKNIPWLKPIHTQAIVENGSLPDFEECAEYSDLTAEELQRDYLELESFDKELIQKTRVLHKNSIEENLFINLDSEKLYVKLSPMGSKFNCEFCNVEDPKVYSSDYLLGCPIGSVDKDYLKLYLGSPSGREFIERLITSYTEQVPNEEVPVLQCPSKVFQIKSLWEYSTLTNSLAKNFIKDALKVGRINEKMDLGRCLLWLREQHCENIKLL